MAGIGFEIRKYLNDDTFSGTFKAYGFAGLISAGPWVLSIAGVMFIGLVGLSIQDEKDIVSQFTTSVTWLMGGSLVLTGLLQLVFTRFVADRIFERKERLINPNLFGALFLTTLCSGLIASALAVTIFSESFGYEVLMAACFVVISNIWIAVIFVAGLKRFKLILNAFAVGYTVTVVFALLLMPFGLNGLLCGLFLGHVVLLFSMLAIVIPEYPLVLAVRFDFVKRRFIFPSLIAIGLFYNLGIWIDKLMFWMYTPTSESIVGPLRKSLIYDLPIFLAYLAIIPGMAVFLLRIETDFVQAYDRFFAAVRGNASLQEIEMLGNRMNEAVRDGLLQIIRVQGATILVLIGMGPSIIQWLGLSEQYVHLYYVNLVGVGAQVLMLAVLNVLFYLDKLADALKITALLLLSNTILTGMSLQAGPSYYGYGFGISMVLTALFGIVLLSRELEHIENRTFMRERPEVASATS
ncbi:MAG: exopolysaccharide Pel transporter PelG [Granulosicoccus sp.]